MRRPARFLAALTVAVALAVPAPATAVAADHGATARAARTLTGAGGFSVAAPGGFRVRGSGGVYTVSNGKVTLVYLRLRTTARASAAGAEVARAAGGRIVRRSGGASTWSATLKVSGRTQRVGVRRSGRHLIVTTARDAKGRGSGAARPPVAHSSLTAAELGVLQRIAATARGGTPGALSASLPLKRFVAPDGRSQALVPSGPGWQYQGGSGQIIVGNGQLGVVSLGLPFFIQYPDAIGSKYPQYPIAPYTSDVAAAVENIFPDYFRRQGSDVRSIRFVRVLAGPLPSPLGFAGTGSTVYGVIALNIGGRPFQGLIYASVGRDDSIFGSYAYTSYLIVPAGGDPRVFNSLLRTWQSWDPSADQRARLAQTLKTLASIDYGGSGIDPQVFDEAAAKWSAYIRGPNE